MDFSKLKVGVLHSVLGGDDGVSIVIDQSLRALRERLGVPAGNIQLLAGRVEGEARADTDESLWHLSEPNRRIFEKYSEESSQLFADYIRTHALKAKEAVARFLGAHPVDVLIAHNSCHVSNFVYGVGLDFYYKEADGGPKYVVWWHDSHLERERFSCPGRAVRSFLKSLPGRRMDGIVFINSGQAGLARGYLESAGMSDAAGFIRDRTAVIPNTCGIPWDWRGKSGGRLAPEPDAYDRDFFEGIGLAGMLRDNGFTLRDSAVLLQHTRVVPRKRIDRALDFAAALARKTPGRAAVLLVSGRGGDEHDDHASYLRRHLAELLDRHPECRGRVFLFFAEERVGPERAQGKKGKVYRFRDIPAIVAAQGGIGVYFSEVEGYGNNLLEMISQGLPAVVNRYPVFESDIEPLGFHLPAADEGRVTDRLVEEALALLSDAGLRDRTVRRNLEILESRLHHGVMAEKLGTLLEKVLAG